MNIITLLELIEPKTSTAKYSGTLKHGRDRYDTIGSGWYSNVKQNRKDPHTVVKSNSKVQHDNDRYYRDGYETYANIVIKKKLYNNPHFPRIYEAKKIMDKTGRHINKYEIERLVKVDDLSIEELESIVEIYFNLNLEDGDRLEYIYDYIYYIDNSIKAAAIYGDYSGIKLPSLKNAIRIIRAIKRNVPDIGALDIGSNNIMYRRGPTGLVPVITDPFA